MTNDKAHLGKMTLHPSSEFWHLIFGFDLTFEFWALDFQG